MHRFNRIASLGLVIGLITAPAAAETVDEVIAKHIQARGGDRWAGVQTMKITGAYTAFSETSDVTMTRMRGHRFLMVYTGFGSEQRTGFDGRTAWSSGGRGTGSIEGLDKSILMRSVDFATPLFDYAQRGFTAKLLGEIEFEGSPTIGIELTRDDDTSETWYLDPKTYLEVGLISPGNDYLGPVDRMTYFEDFREVDGLKMPFYVESQWFTRSRVLEVADVELNVDVDAASFRMPPLPGIGKLASMVGTWDVTLAQRQSPEDEWRESQRTSTIEDNVGGAVLDETWNSGRAVVRRSYSHDPYTEKFRVTQIDSRSRHMDVQEGAFTEDGKLIISNVETGTASQRRGETVHSRLTFFEITEDGFKIEYENSTDGGETWTNNAKATYVRKDG